MNGVVIHETKGSLSDLFESKTLTYFAFPDRYKIICRLGDNGLRYSSDSANNKRENVIFTASVAKISSEY